MCPGPCSLSSALTDLSLVPAAMVRPGLYLSHARDHWVTCDIPISYQWNFWKNPLAFLSLLHVSLHDPETPESKLWSGTQELIRAALIRKAETVLYMVHTENTWHMCTLPSRAEQKGRHSPTHGAQGEHTTRIHTSLDRVVLQLQILFTGDGVVFNAGTSIQL